ncbi:MAG: NACHT domain-containing protein [Proteobacteria bacterium]|nr:NACHT domain-containing protein [Pseudomonadota bacterium]
MDPRFLADDAILSAPLTRPGLHGRARDLLLTPHAPGILVHGEPGCGKTFFLRRLAASLAREGSARPVFPLALDTTPNAAPVLALLTALLEEAPADPALMPPEASGGVPPSLSTARERWASAVARAGRPVVVFLDDLSGLLSGLSAPEKARFAEALLVPGVVPAASASWRIPLNKAAFGPWERLIPLELSPLTSDEASGFWRALAREESPEVMGACLAMAQGNPRVLAALAAPAPGAGFPERLQGAAAMLSRNFDPLFEALPPAERRLFACLAQAWNPATAREAGLAAGMDVNKASSLASRLAGRGLARVARREGRRKWYEVRHPGLALTRQAAHPAGRKRLAALDRFLAALLALDSPGPGPQEDGVLPLPVRSGEAVYPMERDVARSLLSQALDRMAGAETATNAGGLPPLEDLEASGLSVPQSGPDPDAAEAGLRRIADETPDDPGAWSRLGAFLHAVRGAAIEAEEAYLAAVDRQSEQAWTWLGLARLLHEDPDRAVDAEQAYRIASSLAPDDPMVWALLGRLYTDLPGREKDAEKALARALALAPDHPVAREALTRVYGRTGREDEAGTLRGGSPAGASWMAEAARSPNPLQAHKDCVARAMDTGDPRAWALAGLLAARSGANLREAAECLERWAGADSDDSPAWLLSAAARLLAGERKNAANILGQVLGQTPRDPDAWLLQGLLMDKGTGIPRGLEQSLSLRPDHPPALAAKALFLAREPGGQDEARLLAGKALKGDPDLAGAWAALGILEARRGGIREAEAEEAFRRVVSVNPDEAWPFVELGALLASQADRLGDAKKALARAVNLDPENARAWRLVGGLGQREGNPAQAVKALEKAAALDPASLETASGLASLFLSDLEDPVSAARAVEEFLGARPGAAPPLDWLGALSGLPGFARMLDLLPPDARSRLPGMEEDFGTGLIAGASRAAGPLAEAARQADPAPALGLLLEMARTGGGREVLDQLRASPARSLFEPLEAALALALGEPPLWPPEILALSRDLAAFLGEGCSGKEKKFIRLKRTRPPGQNGC